MGMKMLSRSVLLVFGLSALMLLPSQCWAQFYAGVYVGAAIPHEGDLDSTLPDLSASIDDIEFDPGVMVGGKAGYWMEALDAPFVGLEVDLYGAFPKVSEQTITADFSGNIAGTPVSAVASLPIQEGDLDILSVGFNLLLRYPEGPIQPYGGVGVGIVHAEFDEVRLASVGTVTGPGGTALLAPGTIVFTHDEDTAAGLQIIGGVKGFLADNIALFGEYKLVITEFEFDEDELDYNASHVYGGIEFYFGPGVANK